MLRRLVLERGAGAPPVRPAPPPRTIGGAPVDGRGVRVARCTVGGRLRVYATSAAGEYVGELLVEEARAHDAAAQLGALLDWVDPPAPALTIVRATEPRAPRRR